jgi:LemA protein
MTKQMGILIGTVLFCFLLVVGSCGSYNGMVNDKETVDQRIGQVQNVYQRRADLIPNLVEVVKGYASHEKGTFEAVTKARASATQVTLSPNSTPEQLAKFQAAQGELSAALGKLMMLKEAYPELKAAQNFLALQAEVAGTENRIAVERKEWQKAVKEYNVRIKRFPASIIASFGGFKPAAFFAAEEGAKTAPKIEFNKK